MIKNYFKIAFRNIVKNKIFSIINILGLSIGMAGSLLILVYVYNELSYEQVHENKDNIYKIGIRFGNEENSMHMAGIMPGFAEAAVNEIPEVKDAARIKLMNQATVRVNDIENTEQNIFFVDPSFFNMFTIKMVEGNPFESFKEPFNIILSQSAAEKYFGNSNPVGKTLIFNQDYSFKVTGVFENITANTSIKSDYIASYKSIERIKPVDNQWNSFGEDHSYVLTNSPVNVNELQDRLQQVLVKNTNEQFAGMFKILAIPFSDIYFHGELMGDIGNKGNISYVYLFSSISLLVLIIACLNFINLSTAKSAQRSKEVGIRKVLGANRMNLLKQFLSESIIITLVSTVFSVILFELFYPVLNNFLDSKLNISHLEGISFYLILLSIILFVGILAGIYPAFFLSRFNPVTAIQKKFSVGSSKLGFRKILVVFQFGITILLIFCTWIITEQVEFMENSDLGFNKDNVLLVNMPAQGEEAETKYETFKNILTADPSVKYVSGAYTFPGIFSREQQTVKLPGMADDENMIMRAVGVDYDYIKTLGVELLKGRNFSKDFSTDRDEAVLLNESAVKKLGLDSPIGKEILIPGGKTNGLKSVKVIGVVSDFHIQSMHESIDPIFFYINPDRFYNIAVKYSAGSSAQVIDQVKTAYAKAFPEAEFNYSFLDETYNNLYISEEKINSIFLIFSFFAVFIACLGLSGLAAHSAEQRTKEIGVRKVLGATVTAIITMLSKDYLKLVVIASIIAFPLSYYIADKWLESFAYKISIGIAPFVIAFLVSFIIAFATVFNQAFKAALTNPVNSIKYE